MPSEPGTKADRAFSRRALLGAFGAGAATAAVTAGGAFALASTSHDRNIATDGMRYDFFGRHQSGIITPMQNSLHFAALEVTTQSRDELISMLRRWSQASAAMMNGLPVGKYGAVNGSYDAPPDDTGDALDLPPSGLTITIGFGPTLFRTKDGTARFGIADRQPDTLHELPRFPGDMLDESICGGDICIQACADDAQVAVHAVRNLVRLAFGSAAVRWSQMGYGKSSSTSHDQPTPRNLFGFKDGTRNITGDDAAGLDSFVWVQPEDAPAWMQGGTYLAVRKIRMTIETWDRSSMREQEATFGRTKKEGAPLSGGSEFTDPDFAVQGRDAAPLIDPTSHMALAHPDSNDGNRILRRAYNYTDGSDGLGRLDAGLFFLSYQRDIDQQFTPMQMRLSRSDRMNEYVKYLSSATFAIPPGCMAPDDYIGRTLFEG